MYRLWSDDTRPNSHIRNFESAEPFYLRAACVRNTKGETSTKEVKMERMCRRRDNRLTLWQIVLKDTDTKSWCPHTLITGRISQTASWSWTKNRRGNEMKKRAKEYVFTVQIYSTVSFLAVVARDPIAFIVPRSVCSVYRVSVAPLPLSSTSFFVCLQTV